MEEKQYKVKESAKNQEKYRRRYGHNTSAILCFSHVTVYEINKSVSQTAGSRNCHR